MSNRSIFILPAGLTLLGLLIVISGFVYHIISPVYNPVIGLISLFPKPVKPVTILDQSNQILSTLSTSETIPGNILLAAHVRLFPGDSLTIAGQTVKPDQPLPAASKYIIQYHPGIEITLEQNGRKTTRFSSSRPTLGAALWDQGIKLTNRDFISTPLDTPLTQPLSLKIRFAVPITIVSSAKTFSIQSAADTVGEALASADFSLQNADYPVPAEDQPIPADHTIQVVRVREQISLEEKTIPFTTETVNTDQVEAGQSKVLQAGQPGLQISRLRVRYENGKETARNVESTWVVTQPVNQKTGVGTHTTVQTINTPSGAVQYYRSLTVYATSYSPCNSDGSRCYPSTASGMKVQKGVIGVTRAWYNLLAGTQVYIPGYGMAVIADIGAGIAGKQWIDLGFSDSDYIAWSQNVTIYFLSPASVNLP